MEKTHLMVLLEKLKRTLAEDLRSQDDQHGKYLVHGKKSISKSQLADEIESGTDLGIEMTAAAVSLAIDLIAREKQSNNVLKYKETAFYLFNKACDELQLAVLGTCVNGGEYNVWDWVHGEPLPKNLTNLTQAKELLTKVKDLHGSIPTIWTHCSQPIDIIDFKEMYINLYRITGHKMYGMESNNKS